MEAKQRLIVALDVSTLDQARKLVTELHDLVGMFKIGLELFCSHGPRAVEAVHEQGGRVFLDLKFHDIPNTVAGAARAATRMGVAMFNLHAAGGAEMMRAAAEAASQEARSGEAPLILAVTVLTSLGPEELREEVGLVRPPLEQVVFWAEQAKDCGLAGVVASPREIRWIRQQCGDGFLIVTPGIRPAGADQDDQQRVGTPGEALAAGASYLVVGRPITKAPERRQAALNIIAEMEASDR
ncbi:MAG: orotidine-5'-phosphate decarboxylase [Thermacetogeniaceae bacterium]